jgi:hypothetical protein
MTSSPQDVRTPDGQVLRIVDPKTAEGEAALAALAGDTEPKRTHWWSRTPKARPERSRKDRRKRAAILAFIGFTVVLGSIESLAVRGQSDFGHWELGLLGWPVYTVAVALEAGAVTWAGLALWAMLTRGRAGLPHLMTAVTVMAAAAASWIGARSAHRPEAGAAYLALASIFALLMWHQIMAQLRRDDLQERGEIKPVPEKPRFGLARWLIAPIETGRAWRWAVLNRVSDPDVALRAVADAKAVRRAARQAKDVPALDLTAEVLQALGARERLAVAFGAIGAVDVPAALAMLATRDAPVDQSYAYQLIKQMGLAPASDAKTPKRRDVKTSKDVAK